MSNEQFQAPYAFGYGTLLFQELVELILGHEVEMQWATLPGFRRCRIVKRDSKAKGPAVKRLCGSQVRGKIFPTTESDWVVLNAFEGFAVGYEPIHGTVLTDTGTSVEVGFYIADESIITLGGEWSELEFYEDEEGFKYYRQERVFVFLKRFWAQHPNLRERWPASTLDAVDALSESKDVQ